MRIHAVVLSLLLVSGCASLGDQLIELRAKKPVSGEFPQALASEYLAYSESLAEEGHPIRADYFAQKGLDALSGKEVAPEDKPEFAEGRAALLNALSDDVKEVVPLSAARAQLTFDCWTEDEKLCKESFATALSDVQYVADALEHGQSNHFDVEFAVGSAEISSQAEAVLEIVVYKILPMNEYQVELTPPTKKGSLATKRMIAVQEYLIKRGVNAGKITTAGTRKGKQVTLSTDKKKQATNKVKIYIQNFAPAEDLVKP